MNQEIFRLHADLEDRHWWFVARRRILRDLIQSVEPPNGGALAVDIGCGTGANIAAIAGEYRTLGIDPSAEAIELARHRFPNVRFEVGHAPGDLPTEAADARVFMLADVLEHVQADTELLRDVVSYAAPGSHFVLTVPADPSLWTQQDVTHGHYRRYTVKSIRALWAGLPVSERLLSPFNARLFPVVKAVRVATRLRGRAAGQVGTDVSMPPRPLNRLLLRIFAGEGESLKTALNDGGRIPYRFGVSLVALLRRESGAITNGQGGHRA